LLSRSDLNNRSRYRLLPSDSRHKNLSKFFFASSKLDLYGWSHRGIHFRPKDLNSYLYFISDSQHEWHWIAGYDLRRLNGQVYAQLGRAVPSRRREMRNEKKNDLIDKNLAHHDLGLATPRIKSTCSWASGTPPARASGKGGRTGTSEIVVYRPPRQGELINPCRHALLWLSRAQTVPLR
jgi:hypothetical protein